MTALLDNELAQSDASTLRSHLGACPTCAATFQQMQQTLRTADTWTVEGSDIWQGMKNGLALEFDKPAVDANNAPAVIQDLSAQFQTLRAITAEQLAETLYVHRNTGTDIERLLVDLGHAAEREVFEAKAQAEGIPFIDLTKHKPEQSAIDFVPVHLARKHNALAVKKDGNKLWVAILNARDIAALDEIRMVTHCQVAPLLAFPEHLERALADAYPAETASPITEPEAVVSQEDLQAVLSEMRALRNEIQELRGEVGTLRRLLAASRQAAPPKVYRPLSPPQMMPLALPETSGIILL
jgi:hypothetical protein